MSNFMTELGLEEDAELMQNWMYKYSSSNAMSIANYLTTWHTYKSQYLLKMFNNELILKKKIIYNMSEERLRMKIRAFLNQPFVYDFLDLADDVIVCAPFDVRRCLIHDIFYTTAMLQNKIISHTDIKQIEFKNGKILRISKHERPFRFLTKFLKLAKQQSQIIYSLSYFEDFEKRLEEFRIQHSQILNTKELKGTLCLSIHPMDYMTMSDNGYKWTSCMSWSDHGCYYAGTTEMLNSSSVIVAYLEGEEPWYPLGKDFPTWSNKKWRELFIVTEDFITGIKGYPYCDAQLETECLNWIKELATENLGFYYINHISTHCNRIKASDNVCIRFDTDFMYNDFENIDETGFYLAVMPTLTNPCYWGRNSSWYEFNYSGPSKCTVCGDVLDAAEYTVCEKCSFPETGYCTHCEKEYDVDCLYQVGEKEYCPGCYQKLFYCCPLCREDKEKNEAITLIYRDESRETRVRVCKDCFLQWEPIKDLEISNDNTVKLTKQDFENIKDNLIGFLHTIPNIFGNPFLPF